MIKIAVDSIARYISAGSSLTTEEKDKLAKIDVGVKSNLNATVAPTVTDDSTKGYGIGSTWQYNNIKYQCQDATKDNAVWVTTEDIYYFDSWTDLITAISQIGTTYINKYAVVANANGGVVGGIIYVAPNVINPYIVDGNSATYKILAQGTKYSVQCQARTITNPVITSVLSTNATIPTNAGYYIFVGIPNGGLPIGNINDIVFYDGSKWSIWQTYTSANTVLVVGVNTNTCVTWRKFNGTWMSTADSFSTDNIETQTGKLWNGKAVYRKGISGTTPSSGTGGVTGIVIPTTGKTVSIFGIINRNDGGDVMVTASGNEVMFSLDRSNGKVNIWAGSTIYQSRPFSCWIEYTKS